MDMSNHCLYLLYWITGPHYIFIHYSFAIAIMANITVSTEGPKCFLSSNTRLSPVKNKIVWNMKKVSQQYLPPYPLWNYTIASTLSSSLDGHRNFEAICLANNYTNGKLITFHINYVIAIIMKVVTLLHRGSPRQWCAVFYCSVIE